MNVMTARAENWDHFKQMVFSDFFDFGSRKRGDFWFRGVANDAWELMSSFDRSFYQFDAKTKDNIEKNLLEQFRKSCEADDDLKDICDDDDRALALGQHSGLPTRLLDWSESPYVAAFFSFQHAFSAFSNSVQSSENDHAAVWMLNPSNPAWSTNQGVRLITTPAWGNIRMYNQKGHFTRLMTYHESLNHYVKDYPSDEPLLGVISVPLSEAGIAMADLDLMGINHDTIYPDLEGRARAAKSRVVASLLSR